MKRIYSLIVAGGLLAAGCDSYFNEDYPRASARF